MFEVYAAEVSKPFWAKFLNTTNRRVKKAKPKGHLERQRTGGIFGFYR